MACDCISRVEKLVKAQTNESGCLDTSIGVPSGIAMVNVYDRLKAEGLKSKLILQVHDELICECPEDEADAVIKILSEEMSGVAKLSVPLIVDAKKGHSWAEAH